MKNILLIFAALHVLSIVIMSQASEYSVPASDDARCELANRYIDALVIAASEKQERIFIISRPGRRELMGVNNSRALYSRSVISDFKKGLPKDQITIAAGERIASENGNLEFWVGSRLFLIVWVTKNQQVCLQVPDYLPSKRKKE